MDGIGLNISKNQFIGKIEQYNPELANLLQQASDIAELKELVNILSQSIVEYHDAEEDSPKKQGALQKVGQVVENIKTIAVIAQAGLPIAKTLYNFLAPQCSLPQWP
jgi:hypothetical protein